MIRRSRAALAIVAVALAVGGCAVSSPSTTGPYWLVRVGDRYATLYRYPAGDKPGTKHAIEFGVSKPSHAALTVAAHKLGVPSSHITNEAST